MGTRHDLSTLPRPERQLYDCCAVADCGRTPRAFSRYCTLHARTHFRTRDPNGRAIRKTELTQYRKLAGEYVTRYADHPAVVAALAFIGATLHDTTLPSALRRQLNRLRVDCAEPRDMLIEFLAIAGLEQYLPHSVNTDATWAWNTGNRVLRVSPVGTVTSASGKRRPANIPARVAQAHGTHLRQNLGAFAVQLWARITRDLESPQQSARAVADAIREHPFGQ